MEQTQPEKRFQAGAISATVWNNPQQKDGKAYEFHSITLSRTYKDTEGNWKHVQSFRANDLPKARLVIDKAFEYLALKV